MNLVTLEGISKSYGERQLLDEVELLINEGDRAGLIGPNGSGKTTLLSIIAGLESPDEGSVTVWGGVRIEFLPQDPQLEGAITVLDYLFSGHSPQLRLLHDYRQASIKLQEDPLSEKRQKSLVQLADEMDRTGNWAAEANAKAILTELGITSFGAALNTLSGGQAKRVALARALIDRADLLILDEPTNHIDADTIDWLEGYLLSVPGALLMVTHDRYFLDRVVNRIIELDRRRLVNFSGNYSRYLELRTARHERLAADEEKRQNLLKRELAWLRRTPMARGTKQKARKQRIEELQRLRYDSADDRVAIALASRRLGKKVLEAEGLSKSFDDLQVFEDISFSLSPGDRIGLIGPNGAGKSTLLNVLAGVVEPDAGSVIWGQTVELGYYDQLSRGLEASKRVIDFINDRAPLIRTADGYRVEAAQMLEWFLFSRPQQQTYISSLSGGERRRLYLLWVLVHQPNVLFLDEPTNDLDIQTLAVLEEFLDHFTGCLVVVSHDRYFLDRNVDFLASFDEDGLGYRYPAPYSSYRQMVREREAAKEGEERPKPASPSQKERKADKGSGLSWKEARELEGLETRIAELEVEKKRLASAINEAGSDYQKLQELAGKMRTLENELEAGMSRWVELAERKDIA